MDGEVQFFLEKSNLSFSQKKIKRILGLDPGLANTGFGVIDCVKGSCHLVSYGTIETKPDFSHQNRLLIIFKKLQEIIKEFKPELMMAVMDYITVFEDGRLQIKFYDGTEFEVATE